ncbi:hypothetical protein A8B78_07045 [Jannaschia sp. EhC01]|nr:hypothetical protein A8B78_07045 [Jannaschia sp. EhC01]
MGKQIVTQRAASLRLSHIATRPDDFQFPTLQLDPYHVEQLLAAYQGGADFGRIDVWKDPEGSGYIVLDGHHRLVVYRRARHTPSVKVTIHAGPYHRVRLVALTENTIARLPMTQKERSNAAWALVAGQTVDGDPKRYSKRELAALCKVAPRTIATMRETAKLLLGREETLPTSWGMAMHCRRNGGGEMDEDARMDWTQTKVDEIDEEIGEAISRYAHRYPEAFQQVLEQRMGQEFGLMIDQHTPEEFEDLDGDDICFDNEDDDDEAF